MTELSIVIKKQIDDTMTTLLLCLDTTTSTDELNYIITKIMRQAGRIKTDIGKEKWTNVDKERGVKKAIWIASTVQEQKDPVGGGPSRYGPKRVYIVQCFSAEVASQIVKEHNDNL